MKGGGQVVRFHARKRKKKKKRKEAPLLVAGKGIRRLPTHLRIGERGGKKKTHQLPFVIEKEEG